MASAVLLRAIAACVLTSILRLLGSRIDVVFGNGIPDSEGGGVVGGLRRCDMRGLNRKSRMCSGPLVMVDVGLLDEFVFGGYVKALDELGDGGLEVIGDGKPDGRGVEGTSGSKISSPPGSLAAAAVAYEMVIVSSCKNSMMRSSENSCNFDGVYDMPMKSRTIALPSAAPYARCM